MPTRRRSTNNGNNRSPQRRRTGQGQNANLNDMRNALNSPNEAHPGQISSLLRTVTAEVADTLSTSVNDLWQLQIEMSRIPNRNRQRVVNIRMREFIDSVEPRIVNRQAALETFMTWLRLTNGRTRNWSERGRGNVLATYVGGIYNANSSRPRYRRVFGNLPQQLGYYPVIMNPNGSNMANVINRIYVNRNTVRRNRIHIPTTNTSVAINAGGPTRMLFTRLKNHTLNRKNRSNYTTLTNNSNSKQPYVIGMLLAKVRKESQGREWDPMISGWNLGLAPHYFMSNTALNNMTINKQAEYVDLINPMSNSQKNLMKVNSWKSAVGVYNNHIEEQFNKLKNSNSRTTFQKGYGSVINTGNDLKRGSLASAMNHNPGVKKHKIKNVMKAIKAPVRSGKVVRYVVEVALRLLKRENPNNNMLRKVVTFFTGGNVCPVPSRGNIPITVVARQYNNNFFRTYGDKIVGTSRNLTKDNKENFMKNKGITVTADTCSQDVTIWHPPVGHTTRTGTRYSLNNTIIMLKKELKNQANDPHAFTKA